MLFLKKSTYSILLFLFSISLHAQKAEINFSWQSMGDSTLFLTYHYGSKIMIADTVFLDSNGSGTFQKDTLLHQGLYKAYINNNNHFDFLLAKDQTLNIVSTGAGEITKVNITGAEESKIFLGYQQYLTAQSQKQSALHQSYKTVKESGGNTDVITEQLKKLDDETEQYISRVSPQTSNSLFRSFVNASRPVNVPDLKIEKSHPKHDSLKWVKTYQFRSEHYLDNINLTDSRLLYTPFVEQRMNEYFNKALLQIPDSIIPRAHQVIEQTRQNPEMFQYTVQYVLNNSSKSKIMGMDEVFVDIAKSYYLSGEATWIDSTTHRKIWEEVVKTQSNLIGNIAPNFTLDGTNEEPVDLHSITGDYTILVFWEPNCGHCKKTLPKLYEEVFIPNMDKDIQVVAVNIEGEKEEWVEFIEEKGLSGWHHAYNPHHENDFRVQYNVSSTPLIYLLDTDKKIIAKKINPEQLNSFLNQLSE